ncbi:MAG TPA: hypothetical protein VIO62_12035 [Candidatus Dormibacteraeota bacterium]|jgi:hypothetical protein
MDYVQILTRALAISWRHKYLWLLAVFAGEATTISMAFQTGSSSRNSYSNVSTQAVWSQLTNWVSAHAALLWTVGITVALLSLALFLLSALANGALVKGGAEHDAERPFGLRQAWSAGVHSFWPVLGLKFFAFVIYANLAIVIGGLILMTIVFGISGAVAVAVATGLLAGVLLLGAIPFFVIFGVAIVLGVRVVVLEGKGANDGFRTALNLIWRRRGRVALFWLLVCIAGIVASTAVGLALVLAAFPIVALTVAAYFAGGWLLAVAAALGFGTAWLIVVATFTGGVRAFTSTCWTVAYTRFDLQAQPAVSPQPQPA